MMVPGDLTVVVGFVFGAWVVAELGVQAPMVEPFDPLRCGHPNRAANPPRN